MTPYRPLIEQIEFLSEYYGGWTLGELYGLSPRERRLWIYRVALRKEQR